MNHGFKTEPPLASRLPGMKGQRQRHTPKAFALLSCIPAAFLLSKLALIMLATFFLFPDYAGHSLLSPQPIQSPSSGFPRAFSFFLMSLQNAVILVCWVKAALTTPVLGPPYPSQHVLL